MSFVLKKNDLLELSFKASLLTKGMLGGYTIELGKPGQCFPPMPTPVPVPAPKPRPKDDKDDEK